jgi:hypothetical protein
MWRMTDRHTRHEIGLRCDVLDFLQRKHYLGHPKVADDDPIDRLHRYSTFAVSPSKEKKNYNKVKMCVAVARMIPTQMARLKNRRSCDQVKNPNDIAASK